MLTNITTLIRRFAHPHLPYPSRPCCAPPSFRSILSNNQNINKLLRFNMLQAINFDIALILPSIFSPLLTWSLGQDAYKISPITDVGGDVVAVTLLVAVAYSIGASAMGALPNKIPFFGRINRVTRDD